MAPWSGGFLFTWRLCSKAGDYDTEQFRGLSHELRTPWDGPYSFKVPTVKWRADNKQCPGPEEQGVSLQKRVLMTSSATINILGCPGTLWYEQWNWGVGAQHSIVCPDF